MTRTVKSNSCCAPLTARCRSVSGVAPARIAKMTTEQEIVGRYIEFLGKARSGGNCLFKCDFCDQQFTGSLTRQKAHLLKIPKEGIRICSKIEPDKIKEINDELQKIAKKKELTSKHMLSDCTSCTSFVNFTLFVCRAI